VTKIHLIKRSSLPGGKSPRLRTSAGIAHTESGLSLLETIASLLIGAPLLFTLIQAMTTGTEIYLRARRARIEIETTLTMKGLLEGAVEHVSAHRLPLEPRIHSPGTLTYLDGTPHPFSHHSLYRPEPESTALSTLELDIDASLIVKGLAHDGSPRVCSRWGPRPESATRLFLAVSVDGTAPVEGSLLRVRGLPDCYTLTVERAQSTALPSPPSIAQFASLFVPVKREYTLYLTARGELRYLSHRGANTTENQPILSGIRRFIVTAVRPGASLPTRFEVTIVHASGRTSSLTLLAPAIHHELYTFLGARP